MARTGILQRARMWLIEALGGMATGGIGFSSNEDAGWRPITERVAGKEYRRDLNPISQADMLKVAHYLYTGNALAQFLINVPVALTVGRNVGYTLEYDYERLKISRDEALGLAQQARRYLDPWWEHPAHDFKGRAARYAKTYLVTGELLLVIPKDGVNETTGLFMLDYIDSALIDNVEGKNGLATTPGRVLVKTVASGPQPFDVMLPTADGRYEGECFFFRHVGRLNSLRGLSDLLAQADWIDLHDQLLFGRVDKAILSNTLVHDLRIEGATNDTVLKEEVEKFAKASKKPGGIYGHNEKVTHEIKKADLNETDNAALVRSVLLHVLGSKGFPEHWFSDAGSTTRASSAEQNDVAYKLLEELQEELLGIFAIPLTVAYDKLAEKQSVFPRRDTGAVRLYPNLPKISERDISRVGGVVANVEAALESAVSSGRLSRRTAQRVTLTLVEKLTGEHVDAEDEVQQVEMEQADLERIAQDRQNAAARAAVDLAKQIGDGGGDPGSGGGAGGNGGQPTVEANGLETILEAIHSLRSGLEVHLHQEGAHVSVQQPATKIEGPVKLEAVLPSQPPAQVTVETLGADGVERLAGAAADVADAAREVSAAAEGIASATEALAEVTGAATAAAGQQAPTVQVNVPVPSVTVNNDVHVPDPKPLKIERDGDGKITGVTPKE